MKYTLGIDFGTLSARALVVRQDGEEIATADFVYPHAVMDTVFVDGSPLPPDFALEHPQDWLDALGYVVPAVLEKAGLTADDIAGVGIDFTSCTMFPVTADGTPLCLTEKFAGEKHAFPKLWKHHASQPQAERITKLAHERKEPWIDRYGGTISPEWMFPKILEILENAPEVYAAADRFTEGGDWIVRLLTGKETHNAASAGYKAMWNDKTGYPSNDYFTALDPRLDGIIGTKIAAEVLPVGAFAGRVNERGHALTGLNVGTAVAVADLDAHVAFPALGITEAGQMLLIVGTSGCHLVMGEQDSFVPGICGVVKDGILPGFYGYEAGQCCVGDHFDWFVKNCVPAAYEKEAQEKGINIHALLREKAEKLAVGESGLIALDWWNGNRSVLVDASLSGAIFGMTLRTRPEEIYRALLEAVAYGTRMILEDYESHGVAVNEIFAGGGIALKDPFFMQIYADVTGRELRVANSKQAPALGSAIFGAAAAGLYPDIRAAAKAMGRVQEKVYRPNPQAKAEYDKLYAEYAVLHDYFGRGGNDVLKKLRTGTI